MTCLSDSDEELEEEKNLLSYALVAASTRVTNKPSLMFSSSRKRKHEEGSETAEAWQEMRRVQVEIAKQKLEILKKQEARMVKEEERKEKEFERKEKEYERKVWHHHFDEWEKIQTIIRQLHHDLQEELNEEMKADKKADIEFLMNRKKKLFKMLNFD